VEDEHQLEPSFVAFAALPVGLGCIAADWAHYQGYERLDLGIDLSLSFLRIDFNNMIVSNIFYFDNNKTSFHSCDHISMTFIVYSDGGCRGNPGISGVGVAIYFSELSPKQINQGMVEKGDFTPVAELSQYLGEMTNNQSEWNGVLHGLEWILAHKGQGCDVVGVVDSELVQRQIMGRYKVKHPLLKPLFEQFLQLKSHHTGMQYFHVLREYNSTCDTLANQAMDTRQNTIKTY